jgi:hypothetical protein
LSLRRWPFLPEETQLGWRRGRVEELNDFRGFSVLKLNNEFGWKFKCEGMKFFFGENFQNLLFKENALQFKKKIFLKNFQILKISIKSLFLKKITQFYKFYPISSLSNMNLLKSSLNHFTTVILLSLIITKLFLLSHLIPSNQQIQQMTLDRKNDEHERPYW